MAFSRRLPSGLSLVVVLAIHICFALPARAWWEIRPSPTTHTLYGVCFSDATHAWAVGDAGTLLASTDAGLTWEARPSPSPYVLEAVDFASPDVGMIISGSYVYRTTDGGATWATLYPAGGAYWHTVYMVDEQTAVVGGDSVPMAPTFARTTDGGQTWSHPPVVLDGDGAVTGLRFWTPDVGIACAWSSGGYILRTTDGGAHWTRDFHSADGYFVGMDALSPDQIVAVGIGEDDWSGYAAFTRDGLHWYGTTVPVPQMDWLQAVSYTGATAGSPAPAVAVGFGGAIARSDDGGKTWVSRPSPTTADLYSVAFITTRRGVAVGAGGVIIRTNPLGPLAQQQPAADDAASDECIADPSRRLPAATDAFSISEASPNPFRGEIRLAVDYQGPVSVGIFDAAGRLLLNETCPSGRLITWNGRFGSGRRVSPGVYLIRVQPARGGPAATRRVVCLGF
jgi:photosystem II stability/assembly factor-like uncharacterized protein